MAIVALLVRAPHRKKVERTQTLFYWKRHDINYKRLSNGKTYRFLDEVVYLYSVHRYSWWNGSQRRRRERATRFCCCLTIWLAVSIFIWVSCSHDAICFFCLIQRQTIIQRSASLIAARDIISSGPVDARASTCGKKFSRARNEKKKKTITSNGTFYSITFFFFFKFSIFLFIFESFFQFLFFFFIWNYYY